MGRRVAGLLNASPQIVEKLGQRLPSGGSASRYPRKPPTAQLATALPQEERTITRLGCLAARQVAKIAGPQSRHQLSALASRQQQRRTHGRTARGFRLVAAHERSATCLDLQSLSLAQTPTPGAALQPSRRAGHQPDSSGPAAGCAAAESGPDSARHKPTPLHKTAAGQRRPRRHVRSISARGESNPYASRRQILSLVRLPVPPLSRSHQKILRYKHKRATAILLWRWSSHNLVTLCI